MLFDTHCHLADTPLIERLSAVLAEACDAGVTRFLAPATTPDDWQVIRDITATHFNVTPAFGIHPFHAELCNPDSMTRLYDILSEHNHAPVGEIGLDFIRSGRDPIVRNTQIAAFEQQLILAKELKRPVSIHKVRAAEACMSAVKKTGFDCGGFIHAYSGSMEEAHLWVKLGFKIGIGSLLLRPQAAKIRNTLAALSDTDFVFETDAPHMSPEKNTVNHPKNTARIARSAAEIRRTDFDKITRQSTVNALTIIDI